MDFSGTSRRVRGRRLKFAPVLASVLMLHAATHAQPQKPAQTASSAPSISSATQPSPGCPPLLAHTVARLQDEKPQALCQYAGKVLLIVNTASFCGFTPQYAGLEALSARYQAQGLVVLGFPSNDFSQEGGSHKEIASFCENTFNVKFPMFTKTTVSGAQAHPLFKQLGAAAGGLPRWNFHKYVVSRDGRTITGFGSSVDPSDPRLRRTIENSLLAK